MAERVDKGMLTIVPPSGASMLNSAQEEGWHRAHNKIHPMTANAFHNISQVEASLWEAADLLRANSNLPSSEYCMPVLGVIFLRHATNRYQTALQTIEAEQAAGTMPKRPLGKADFIKRRALMLPTAARYDTLLNLPSGSNLGGALVAAMNAIEADFPPLQGSLPKDYDRFDNKLLEDLLRCFDSQALRTATGDVFGRIYEYFLMKFAMQGAQDNGEFFTPPSLVQTLVNVIEPRLSISPKAAIVSPFGAAPCATGFLMDTIRNPQ